MEGVENEKYHKKEFSLGILEQIYGAQSCAEKVDQQRRILSDRRRKLSIKRSEVNGSIGKWYWCYNWQYN